MGWTGLKYSFPAEIFVDITDKYIVEGRGDKMGDNPSSLAVGASSLPQLFYSSCQRITPYNLSLTLGDVLGGVSSDDRELLGLIFCLRENNRPPLTNEEQKSAVPQLLALFKQVRDISRQHPNESIVVVSKTERLVFFVRDGKIFRRLVDRVAFGRNPLDNGPKVRIYDHRTPEGEYRVVRQPGSKYRYFIGFVYPTVAQAEAARKSGEISLPQFNAIREANRLGTMPPSNTHLGGHIGMHGLPVKVPENSDASATNRDWSLGCITLNNYMARRYYQMRSIKWVVILH